MARLTIAERKKREAAARKRASRARLAEGGSYEARLELDARIGLILGLAAEELGWSVGEVVDDLASTYPLLMEPKWITTHSGCHSVETLLRVKVETREILGSREPYLLPADVVEWLVLSACKMDLASGILTYEHKGVVIPTTMRHVRGGLRRWDGARWEGPFYDRYADRMADRAWMREHAQSAAKFRKVMEGGDYDEVTEALALGEARRRANVESLVEAGRAALSRERMETARAARLAAEGEAWSAEAAYRRALDFWHRGGQQGPRPEPPPGMSGPTESHRIGDGSGDDASWYVPASQRGRRTRREPVKEDTGAPLAPEYEEQFRRWQEARL